MARPSPVTAKMEMEIDPPANPPEAADAKLLFTAAESGDAAAFSNLSPDQLRHARSLRNDDRRSLLHVAAASGHAEVNTSSFFICFCNCFWLRFGRWTWKVVDFGGGEGAGWDCLVFFFLLKIRSCDD